MIREDTEAAKRSLVRALRVRKALLPLTLLTVVAFGALFTYVRSIDDRVPSWRLGLVGAAGVLALLGLRWLGKRCGDPFTLEGVPRGARRARSTLAEAEHQAEDASDADATEDERRARRR